MNNIYLHSHSKPGMLKGDINKKKPAASIDEYSTIEEHGELNHKCVIKIPSEPVNRLNELTKEEVIQKIDTLIERMTGFSCVAEYNHHRRYGG
jgi:hypothetical protein